MQDLSKIVAILSIAFITLLFLFIINLIKVYKLKQENKGLQQQLNKK